MILLLNVLNVMNYSGINLVYRIIRKPINLKKVILSMIQTKVKMKLNPNQSPNNSYMVNIIVPYVECPFIARICSEDIQNHMQKEIKAMATLTTMVRITTIKIVVIPVGKHLPKH